MIILAIWLASGLSLNAGPWARGQGNVFLSTSATTTWPQSRPAHLPDIYGAAYLEYGVTDRLTFGFDAGSADYQNIARTKAVGFMRYTLTRADQPVQMAVDIGAGVDQNKNVIRLGASVGRGIAFGDTSGWVVLDGVMHHAPKPAQSAYGLDLTLGINRAKHKYIAQLSAYQSYRGTPYVSITPSIVRQLGKRAHLEIGATLGLKNKPDPALKIGIWQEF